MSERLREAGYELNAEGLCPIRRKESIQSEPKASMDSLASSRKEKTPERPVTSSFDDIPIKSKVEGEKDIGLGSRPPSANAPPTLSREEEQEFEVAIRIFGLRCISCLLSPLFNLREEGMKLADAVLKDASSFDQDELVDATIKILGLVGSDSREKSHSLMINLYYSLIGLSNNSNTYLVYRFHWRIWIPDSRIHQSINTSLAIFTKQNV